ncbi:hypothetical protein [Aureimonas glaciei]|uniref:hypothetical protein n=1 Tax=Aureimonas glaciei TaxID=1776957 RepID=UPI00166CC011|nr:hypothetical protein [Aureimonas glaciei]
MVSAFQIALATGAVIGGLLLDTAGISSAFFVASGVCVAGAVVAVVFRARDTFRPSASAAPHQP